LLNERLEVDKLATGAPADVPVPVSVAACGLLELSLIVSVPVRVPLAVGVKVTLSVHVEPAATPGVQLSVSAKSPLIDTPVICKGAVPLLESVTVCGELVVPTVWLPKVKLVGEGVATGWSEIFVTNASP